MKQNILRIALGLVIVLVFIGHAAKFYEVGIITQLDNIIYDARLKVTMPGGIDERIGEIDLDFRRRLVKHRVIEFDGELELESIERRQRNEAVVVNIIGKNASDGYRHAVAVVAI